jgi:hemerythrin-like domain-containing protein
MGNSAMAQTNIKPKSNTGKKSSTAATSAMKPTDKSPKEDALVLRELYSDHRNIDKTLKAYVDQLDLYRANKPFNLQLMYDVMSYVVLNPDQYHHPLEDTFFSLIAIKDATLKEEVDKTTDEHQLIKDAGEAVLECLADQLRAPTSLKESHIVVRSEKYISLLRGHMDREEALLFRPGSKLLSKRDWRELADMLQGNPDDPLFNDQPNENYLSLKQYLQERIEETSEILARQEYLQLNNLIESVGVLASSASDIGGVISQHSKGAWQDTKASCRKLVDEDSSLKTWLTTPLRCSLHGLDHYAQSLSDIAQILHRTGDSLGQDATIEQPRKKR